MADSRESSSLFSQWRGVVLDRLSWSPSPLVGESFHVHPNPRATTATSHRVDLPTRGQLACTVGVLAGATILWKLYRRWRATPYHPSFAHRTRLQRKFVDLADDVEGAGDPLRTRPSWLYRLFFHTPPEPQSPTSPTKRRQKRFREDGSAAGPRRSASPTKLLAPSGGGRPAGPAFGPSPAQQLSGSERFRQFLAEAKQLAELPHPIIISDPTTFYLKRERMRESNRQRMRASASGRESNMHIVCAFDRTLTSLRQYRQPAGGQDVPPPHSLTSQSLLNSFLPSSYDAKTHQLFQSYYPMETSPHVSPAEKEQYMREWWTKSHALLSLDEYRLTRNKLRHMAKSTVETGAIQLREGVMDLLRQGSHGQQEGLCQRYNIPLVIVSGSIHDCIEELLLQHDVRVWNSNCDLTHASDAERQRYAESNLLVVANRIRWSVPPVHSSVMDLAASMPNLASASAAAAATGLSPSVLLRRTAHHHAHSSSLTATSSCLGFDHAHLVHSLNKTYARLLDQPEMLTRLKDKQNIVLLGNTVADASLADGVEHKDRVLHEWMQRTGQLYSNNNNNNNDNSAPQQQQPQQQQFHPSSHLSHSPFADHPPSYHLPPPHYSSDSHADAAPTHSSLSSSSSSSSFDVLRIGFLNADATPERVAAFARVYDVVICADQGFDFVHRIMREILGADEEEDRLPRSAHTTPHPHAYQRDLAQRSQHAPR